MHETRNMTIEDYPAMLGLWNRTEGLALSEADSEEAIAYYLTRNEGMSFVCTDGGKVIGTVLCGHDGRRGFIYHVAVDRDYRGRSVGSQLVERSLRELQRRGIHKCHIMVIADNEGGNQFWNKAGWLRRDGILLYSKNT